MSHTPAKTNYVKPHAKANYIRPMFCHYERENRPRDSINMESPLRNSGFSNKELGSLRNPDSLKNIEDFKDKHIQNLSSAHSKIIAEVDKIHNWSTSIESELKKKDKKVGELNQTIETQRKVLIDLQMQNEKLSAKLDQEIQQRVPILEKFYLTKELFSALRKKFVDLQKQLDACFKAKKVADVQGQENIRIVEDLNKKVSTLFLQSSERIAILNNSLNNEKNNTIMLKKMFEQQCLTAEQERKSLCKLIENYIEEIKNFSQDLECEKNKVLNLQLEKNDLLQEIAQQEKLGKENFQKLENCEKQLQLTMESKVEIEKQYSMECVTVNNLNKKLEELEELIKKQENDFEKKCLEMKTTINSLEISLSELKQKLEESEFEKAKLSRTLEEKEKEKCCLQSEISTVQKENKELQNKLDIDAKICEESINLLMKEKNDLIRTVSLLKDDLQTALSDKEKLTEVCSDSDKRISELTKEYEIAEQEVKELSQLKLKYDDCLIKIKEQEKTLLSLSEELEVKDMKIQELTTSEERLGEALIKIEELESDLSSKNELLISKELCIEKSNSIKKNYDSAVEKIKEMEDIIKQNSEELLEKEKKIMGLTRSMEEQNIKLEKLIYENLEIKDHLKKERESFKVCLDCEMLKDKVKEMGHLKRTLTDTERELNKQKLQTSHISKMLSETEDNFDEMRIKKEKEIIKCKDTIESLQHELKILKVEVREIEKIRCQNDKLHLTIEEIKLQNDGDIQRLKAEIESLKSKNNNLSLESESAVLTKVMSAVDTEKTKHEPKTGEVMEADSLDEVTIIDEEKPQSSMHKKFSKSINRKVMTHQMQQSTPLMPLEKRKRAWETDSSGSECLEIIFDKTAEKVKGFTPKAKSPYVSNKTPANLISSEKLPTSQEKKRNVFEVAARKMNPKREINNPNTANYFATKSTPQKKKAEHLDSSEALHFQPSKICVKEINFANSPWREQAVQRTPTTPADRKFFKTPLKERENPFKKPQLQKLWF